MKSILFLMTLGLGTIAGKPQGGSPNPNSTSTNTTTNTNTPPADPQAAAKAQSRTDIVAAVQRNCVSCHNATGTGSKLNLTVIGAISTNAVAIMTSIENGTMPPAGTVLSAADRQIFNTWKSLGYPAPTTAPVAPAVVAGSADFTPSDCNDRDDRRRGKGKGRRGDVDVSDLLDGIVANPNVNTNAGCQ